MLVLAAIPPALMAVSPLNGGWLYALLVLAFIYYWQWYSVFVQLYARQQLTLTAEGQIHWFEPRAGSGQLVAGGLVAQYALKLCWQDGASQRRQRWVFADQCSAMQYRALARSINQTNWAATTADKPFSDDR